MHYYEFIQSNGNIIYVKSRTPVRSIDKAREYCKWGWKEPISQIKFSSFFNFYFHKKKVDKLYIE